MTRRLLAGAALVAAFAGAAHAQDYGRMRDPFGEGTVSRADAQAKAVAEFARLDVDHDGFLSTDELGAMMADMRGDRPPPPPPGDAGAPPPPPPPPAPPPDGPGAGMMGAMMMMRADTDGDGKLSQPEFVAMAMKRFDKADANHDGQLTKAERDDAGKAMRGRWRDRHDGDGRDVGSPPPDDAGDGGN